MKLKRKILQWGLVAVASMAALASLTSIVSLISPPAALAAASSIPIINDQGAGAACVASVHKPTNISDVINNLDNAALSQTWSSTWYSPDNASNPGGVDTNALKAAMQQQSAVYIDFGSVNPQYSAECGVTMLLAQSPSSPFDFYGIWIDHKDSQIILQQASVKPSAKTITLTLHPKSGGVSYTANLGDPNSILGGPLFDTSTGGGGGGTAGTNDGSCVVSVATDADLKNCIDTAATSFLFENAATINFGNDTYVATNWSKSGSGNNEIQYMLQPGGFAGHLSGKTSEIDLNTQTYDINLDSLDSTNIQSFFSSLQKAAADGTVNVTFHNYNKEGNPSTYKNLKVASTNISIFAQYYPASDQVATVFQNGGDNEKYEIGTYGPGASLKYSKQSATVPSGCTASAATPFFTFQSDPKQLSTGSITTAAWTMFDTSCNAYSGNIQVQALAADATVPVTTTDNNPNGTSTQSCESSGGPLSWIMCKVLDYLADGVGGIYAHVVEPMLETPNLASTSQGQQLKQAWSNFRIFGDIFLVIALLVIVFGESIGGGAIDAYTAKKVLPRLLAAAILLNLSFYIVGVVIDITNIVGKGIGTLVTSAFGLSNGGALFNFNTADVNGAAQGGALTLGAIGVGSGALASIFAAAAITSGGIAIFMEMMLFFVLIPALLIMLSIVVTLVVRLGIIFLLVMLSPVAFALYTLPNTEKYFKQWWKLLQQTAMVFPIVATLFALSAVMAKATVLGTGNKGFVLGGVGYVVSLAMLVMPLALIPFAFKISGGLLGKVYEMASTGRQKLQESGFYKHRRELAGQKYSNASIQGRQEWYQKLQANATKAGTHSFRGRASRFMANRVGGHNIEAAASAVRAQQMKEVNDQIATGRDEEVRGLTVNKSWAQKQGALVEQADGSRSNGWMRVKDGFTQFKSLGGQWINEADVDAGHERWGRNTFAQQAALAYEMRKAQTENQLQKLSENYHNVATGEGGWGNTKQQAGGSWIGAAFEHQNQHLEYKYTDWETGALSKADGFVDEIYEKKGSYPLAQMSSHTLEQLKRAYEAADPNSAAGAERRDKIRSIAETFMHQYGGVGGDETQLAAMQAEVEGRGEAGREPVRQTSAPGAAHIAERVRELASMTGVARNPVTGTPGIAPTGEYGPAHSENTPTPNRKEHS